jgi:WD40 repeat protein
MPPQAGNEGFKYWAFISYSHRDKRWGDWLHSRLEGYRVPRRLVGKKSHDGEVPARVFPIFRDREELPVSSDLPANIAESLQQSRYLIVICSPAAAKSRWVNEEIKTFKRLGRENRILSLIVGGEPNASDGKEGFQATDECFPEAMRYHMGENGELSATRIEPIAADARTGKDGKANAKLKLLAGLIGVDFDALRQRELVRKVRRLQFIVAAAVLLITTFGAIAWYAWQQKQFAEQKQGEANQERDRALQALANTHLREGLNGLTKPETSAEGIAHLAQAVRIARLPLAETRLWTIFQQRQFWLDVASASPPPRYVSPDQRTIDPRFIAVTFNGKHVRPSFFARSADGRVCVTIVNPAEPGETQPLHFRVWRSDGTPVMPWQTTADAYEKDVRALDGAYLSDDGTFVAVVAFAWRQPAYLEIWNTRTKKRVGPTIEATGRSPNHQNVGFGKVQFLSRHARDSNATSCLLLTASDRGDASLYEVMEDSYDLLGRCSHAADVTAAEIDDKEQWLVSASSDREVRVCDLRQNKPIGHPFLAPQKVQSVKHSAPDKLSIGLGENNGAEYQLSSLLTVASPMVPLQHTADSERDDKVPEGGPNALPLPSPGTVLTQSHNGVLVVRSISPNEIAIVEARKNGQSRQQWSHRFGAPVFAARFESNDSRVVIQTSTFVTEIWDPLKNQRIGAPIDEGRLFADNEIPGRPLLSMLDARGDRLLTRSFFWDPPNAGNYWFTVWDVATGLPLMDRMHTYEGIDDTDVNRAEFSDDQKMLLLGDMSHPEKPAKCLQLDLPDSLKDLLPSAAEGLGGLKLEADGSFSAVTQRADKVNALVQQFGLAKGK